MHPVGRSDSQWLIEHFGSDDLEVVNKKASGFFQKCAKCPPDYWKTHRPDFQPGKVKIIENQGDNRSEFIRLAGILTQSPEVPLEDKAKIVNFIWRSSGFEENELNGVSSAMTVLVEGEEIKINYRLAAHCYWLREAHDHIEPPYRLELPAGTTLEDFKNFLKTMDESEARGVKPDLAAYMRIMSIANWINYDFVNDHGSDLLGWFERHLAPDIPDTLEGQIADLQTILEHRCPLSPNIADKFLSDRINKYIKTASLSGQQVDKVVQDLTPFQSLFEKRNLKIELPWGWAFHLEPLFTTAAHVMFKEPDFLFWD